MGEAAGAEALAAVCVLADCESCAAATSGVAVSDAATMTARAVGAMQGCFMGACVILFLVACDISVVSYI